MEVKLEGRLTGGDDRHVLVPIGATRLADTEDVVVVTSTGDELRAAPPYERGALSPDDERALLVRYGVRVFENARLYERAIFDDRHFLGRRRHAHDRPYVTPIAQHLPDRASTRAEDGAAPRHP